MTSRRAARSRRPWHSRSSPRSRARTFLRIRSIIRLARSRSFAAQIPHQAGARSEAESPARHVPARGAASSADALDVAPVVESRTFHAVDDDLSAVERCGVQRDAAEPLQVVVDPAAAEIEAALAMRRAGADLKTLRRALRRIEELLDDE